MYHKHKTLLQYSKKTTQHKTTQHKHSAACMHQNNILVYNGSTNKNLHKYNTLLKIKYIDSKGF